MTANELRVAMEDIAAAKGKDYAKKLAELDSSAKTELKALKISCNIADICKKFTGFFLGYDYYYSKREAVIASQFLSGYFEDFGEYMRVYDLMSDEQKQLFIVYAYPVMSVRLHFINNIKNNRKAVVQSEKITENDAASKFEADIIKGVANEIIEEWAKLWQKYGFPAEKAGNI